jgi:Ca-activated chloride channel family protein
VSLQRIALLLALAATHAHAGGTAWVDLWRNADQRGQQLLRQGDAAAAAKTFVDPRRKAYAELQAGDYAQAARDLAGHDDSDDHYNRGNALAHAGDLPGALDAYDAALKRDPRNRDARHNRELVANALKRNQAPPRDSTGAAGDQSGQPNGNRQPTTGAGQSSDNRQADAAKPAAAGQRNGGQPSAAQAAAEGNRGGQPAGTDLGAQARHDSATRAAAPAGGTQTGGDADRSGIAKRNEAEQARQDAAEGQRLAGAKPADGAANDGTARGAAVAAEPPSEKGLALEQWLRSIPDDPGGLLRRKFLIEYLTRKQKAQHE